MNFIVQVWTCGKTRVAYIADYLPLPYGIALCNAYNRKVCVAGVDAVLVLDDYKVFEAFVIAYGYNLTVCFSSSIDGAAFEGAIGSTLLIDKVRIYCEEEAE